MALLPTSLPPPLLKQEPLPAANGMKPLVESTDSPSVSMEERSPDPFVTFTSSMVPNQSTVANGSLPFGFFFCPVVNNSIGYSPPVLRREPIRCSKCAAFVNPYCKVDKETGNWNCIFCSHTNSTGARDYATDDCKSALELLEAAVDWLPPSDTNLRSFSLPGEPASGGGTAPPLVYAIDESLDAEEAVEVAAAVLSAVQALPPNTLVGVLTYGASVAVYDLTLSGSGVATCEVLSGAHPPAPALLRPLLYGTGAYLAPVHAALPALKALLSSLRPNCPARPRALRDRCLGPALEVAVALLRGNTNAGTSHHVGGRVLVIAGGHPSLGPGGWPADEDHPQRDALMAEAAEYLEHLGRRAQTQGVFVDVLAGARAPVGVALLEPLVREAGGCLVLHEGFGERFARDLRGAPARLHGARGQVDMRASCNVALSRLIGPVSSLPAGAVSQGEAHGGGVGSSGAEERWSENTCLMHTLEPGLALAGVLLLTEEVLEDAVYFQFVVRYLPVDSSSSSGSPVMRVVTRRLGVAPSLQAYLQAVHPDTAALLTAKLTVLNVQKGEESSPNGGRAVRALQAGIGPRLLDAARTLQPQAPATKGLRSMVRALPEEVSVLASRLYSLERGPLLGDVLGHPDERRALQARFLSASPPLASIILSPSLYVYGGNGSFTQLPAVDLAMLSDAVLVLDHATEIFIWTGLERVEGTSEGPSAEVQGEVDAFVETLCQERFPYPVIRSFKEGSSMSRYLTCRLEPLHKEGTSQQEARFPALCLLDPKKREKLQQKLANTEELSFGEWMCKIPLRVSNTDTYDIFVRKTNSVIQGDIIQGNSLEYPLM